MQSRSLLRCTVLYREGDYIGSAINLAARVASAGAGGQYLITEDLRDAVGDLSEANFTGLPPQRLKGIPDPDLSRRSATSQPGSFKSGDRSGLRHVAPTRPRGRPDLLG
jgi:hypothetical protein